MIQSQYIYMEVYIKVFLFRLSYNYNTVKNTTFYNSVEMNYKAWDIWNDNVVIHMKSCDDKNALFLVLFNLTYFFLFLLQQECWIESSHCYLNIFFFLSITTGLVPMSGIIHTLAILTQTWWKTILPC